VLDRYAVRWIMATGTLIFTGGIWLLAQTNNISQYVIVFGITMAAANAFTGAAASQTTISRWFTRSRGRAFGISAVGTSVGGIAIPALVTWSLQSSGWRATLENLGLTIALIMLPVVILTIRGKPSDIGQFPEGGNTSAASAQAGPELGLGDIIRQPAYWYIGISLGLMFSVYTSTLANITPYATALGTTSAQASTLIMTVAIMGLVGKLLFGMAADKVSLELGLWLGLALVFAALLILASDPGYPLMLLASGLMGPLITLLVLPGFAVIGRLFDATGSYQLCLLIFSGVILVAALTLVPVKLSATDAGAA